jgi:hypothetical protein
LTARRIVWSLPMYGMANGGSAGFWYQAILWIPTNWARRGCPEDMITGEVLEAGLN